MRALPATLTCIYELNALLADKPMPVIVMALAEVLHCALLRSPEEGRPPEVSILVEVLDSFMDRMVALEKARDANKARSN